MLPIPRPEPPPVTERQGPRCRQYADSLRWKRVFVEPPMALRVSQLSSDLVRVDELPDDQLWRVFDSWKCRCGYSERIERAQE